MCGWPNERQYTMGLQVANNIRLQVHAQWSLQVAVALELNVGTNM